MTEARINRISVLVFRIMLSLIFLTAAVNHLVKPENVAQRLVEAKMGFLVTSLLPAEVMVIMAGIGLLIGGLSLLFGFKTKLAAGLLILLIIPLRWSSILGQEK